MQKRSLGMIFTSTAWTTTYFTKRVNSAGHVTNSMYTSLRVRWSRSSAVSENVIGWINLSWNVIIWLFFMEIKTTNASLAGHRSPSNGGGSTFFAISSLIRYPSDGTPSCMRDLFTKCIKTWKQSTPTSFSSRWEPSLTGFACVKKSAREWCCPETRFFRYIVILRH